MENEKAKAAKRWNVPVVVAEWITESLKEQKRLNVEQFDPSQIEYTSDGTFFMPTPQRRKTMQSNAVANNMSVRSVYPPSTQKGAPSRKLTKNTDAMSVEPKPSTSKDVQPRSANESSPDASKKTKANAEEKTPPGFKTPGSTEVPYNGEYGNISDLTEEQIEKIKADLKATFPYSDETFENMLEDLKARGIDLDQVSPFTSFEERRLCNPNPDSPLLLGLPRHESRALKEQFEIAINRTPNFPTIKMRPPTSTPLAEVRRRLNEVLERQGEYSASASPPPGNQSRVTASTPKTNYRKVATLNRLSVRVFIKNYRTDSFQCITLLSHCL